MGGGGIILSVHMQLLGISSLYSHCHRRVNGRKGQQASVL